MKKIPKPKRKPESLGSKAMLGAAIPILSAMAATNGLKKGKEVAKYGVDLMKDTPTLSRKNRKKRNELRKKK